MSAWLSSGARCCAKPACHSSALKTKGPNPATSVIAVVAGGSERLRHQREGTVETDREDPVVHDLHRRSRAGERAVSHQAYPARATSSRI